MATERVDEGFASSFSESSEVVIEIAPRGEGQVFNGRALKPGDRIRLPLRQAAEWVRTGNASFTTRIRVRKAGLLVGNRVCAEGEEVTAAPDLAERWAAAGLVEVLGDLKARQPAAAAV